MASTDYDGINIGQGFAPEDFAVSENRSGNARGRAGVLPWRVGWKPKVTANLIF